MIDSDDDFELERAPAAEADRLTLDLDGWEGPLDLLLTLARSQKVDLAKISILALVEQYLAFIADAKKLRLEIAADYLVMAAWLAYLKSCLLLPKEAGRRSQPRGAGDAAAAAAAAAAGDARGRRAADRRATGSAATSSCAARPRGCKVVRRAAWQADLYDLIAAYGIVRARTEPAVHVVARRPVMTLDEAIHRLERMIGDAARMDRARGLPARDAGSGVPPLGAGLELRRDARAGPAGQGRARSRTSAFAPLYVRAA